MGNRWGMEIVFKPSKLRQLMWKLLFYNEFHAS
jgi:hypothetical protein